jgi:hypothetical protein
MHVEERTRRITYIVAFLAVLRKFALPRCPDIQDREEY